MNPTVSRSRPSSTCEMRSHTWEQSPSPARHNSDDNQAHVQRKIRKENVKPGTLLMRLTVKLVRKNLKKKEN